MLGRPPPSAASRRCDRAAARASSARRTRRPPRPRPSARRTPRTASSRTAHRTRAPLFAADVFAGSADRPGRRGIPGQAARRVRPGAQTAIEDVAQPRQDGLVGAARRRGDATPVFVVGVLGEGANESGRQNAARQIAARSVGGESPSELPADRNQRGARDVRVRTGANNFSQGGHALLLRFLVPGRKRNGGSRRRCGRRAAARGHRRGDCAMDRFSFAGRARRLFGAALLVRRSNVAAGAPRRGQGDHRRRRGRAARLRRL